MIFYGWGKTSKLVYGEITSQVCDKCRQSNKYNLVRIITWFTLFFIPIIPYKFKYYRVCKNCESMDEIKSSEARKIINSEFYNVKSKNIIKAITKYFLIIVAIFLIILACDIFIDNEEDLTDVNYKNLVDCSNSDYFNIYDINGNYKASIECSNNTKRYDVLVQELPYTDEVNQSDHIFTEYDYYYERAEDELVLDEEEAAVIVDDNNVTLRYYWYDTYDNTLYWHTGITDLSKIVYSQNEALYSFEMFDENNNSEYYVRKYQKNNDYRMITTFYVGYNIDNEKELVSINIDSLNDNIVDRNSIYYIETKEITQDSSINDIIKYITSNNISPDEESTYTYYNDTSIPIKTVYTYYDSETCNYETEEYLYTVDEKDNYYIQYIKQNYYKQN